MAIGNNSSSATCNPKILLVNPPTANFFEAPYPPLGLAYITAVLEDNGYHVDIMDMPILGLEISDVRKVFTDYCPDIVGITSMTSNYPVALKIAEVAKEVFPRSLVCYGGPHASFADCEVLNESQAIDVVVRGEGEFAVLELARAFRKRHGFSHILGVTFRHRNSSIVRNGERPLIEDLDILPLPARHRLPMAQYRKISDKTSIISSRGCIHQCSFCQTSALWHHTIRQRSAVSVIEEIEAIKESYDFTAFAFVDDLFLFDKRSLDIFDEIKKRGLKINWTCSSRVDLASRESLRAASDSGCIGITFGIESGVQKTLDTIQKKITIGQVKNVVSLCREFNIEVKLNFIFGLPYETKTDIETTRQFINELNPENVTISSLILLPGTDLAINPDKYGLKIAMKEWGSTVETSCLSVEGIYQELESCAVDLKKKGIRKRAGW